MKRDLPGPPTATVAVRPWRRRISAGQSGNIGGLAVGSRAVRARACAGVLRARDHGAVGPEPGRHRVHPRHGPDVVDGAGQHVHRQRHLGQLRHAVLLGHQLPRVAGQLFPSGGQPAALEELPYGRRLARVGGLRRIEPPHRPPHLGHLPRRQRLGQQPQPGLLALDHRGGPRAHQRERGERRRFAQHGGAGDEAAQRVPEQVYGAAVADRGGLRQHVPGQLRARTPTRRPARRSRTARGRPRSPPGTRPRSAGRAA